MFLVGNSPLLVLKLPLKPLPESEDNLERGAIRFKCVGAFAVKSCPYRSMLERES